VRPLERCPLLGPRGHGAEERTECPWEIASGIVRRVEQNRAHKSFYAYENFKRVAGKAGDEFGARIAPTRHQ